jgi:hypothetical protein
MAFAEKLEPVQLNEALNICCACAAGQVYISSTGPNPGRSRYVCQNHVDGQRERTSCCVKRYPPTCLLTPTRRRVEKTGRALRLAFGSSRVVDEARGSFCDLQTVWASGAVWRSGHKFGQNEPGPRDGLDDLRIIRPGYYGGRRLSSTALMRSPASLCRVDWGLIHYKREYCRPIVARLHI